MRARPPIVLVHGAWGGAWIWRRVLPLLREAGHEVHAATLTGDGDRAHLRTAEIGLQTHIDDVLALIRAEELSDVLLVGHSYGGLVITGVAAALQSADEGSEADDDAQAQAQAQADLGTGRLSGLAYVDAMVPAPGEGWGVSHSPEVAAARIAAAAAHGGTLPPPDPEGFGLSAADADWLRRRHVAHPFGMYREPLHFDATPLQSLPRLFIDCTAPAYPTIAPSRERVRQQPGWQVAELETGHFPMVSEPAALAARLLEFAQSIATSWPVKS